MGDRASKVYCVLVIAYVLANFCIWTSNAEGEGEAVRFPPIDDKTTVPFTLMARLAPKDDDAIVFTQDRDHHGHTEHEDKHVTDTPQKKPLKIPLDLIQRLNNIENATELRNYINSETMPDYEDPVEVGNRFGEEGDDVDRKAAVSPKPAICNPELITVPLQDSDDTSVYYYPSCTRVERCGGCCVHELLSCQPTATEPIIYQVIETRYEGGSQLSYKGKKYVTVDQHTKCKCDCKVKEEHCNKLQRYEKSECACICINMDEEQKCIADNDTKLWDSKECTCTCRYTKECSTGFYFDLKTCDCSPVPIIRRRVSDSNMEIRHRWGDNPQLYYKVTPRPVMPLNKVTDKDDGE